jgi:hypothetical protein
MDDRTEDIEAIKLMRARYGRAADTKDFDLLRSTITDDYTCDTGAGPTIGADAFMARVREDPGDLKILPRADAGDRLASPTTATGIWAVHIMARFPTGGRWTASATTTTRTKVDGS